MDIRETLNRQDYTKLDEFSKQLEGFERLFADKDLLEMRQELAKLIRMRSLVYAQKLMDIKQVLWMH